MCGIEGLLSATLASCGCALKLFSKNCGVCVCTYVCMYSYAYLYTVAVRVL